MEKLKFLFFNFWMIAFAWHSTSSMAAEGILFHYQVQKSERVSEILDVLMDEQKYHLKAELLPQLQVRNPHQPITSLDTQLDKASKVWLEIPAPYLNAQKLRDYFYRLGGIKSPEEKPQPKKEKAPEKEPAPQRPVVAKKQQKTAPAKYDSYNDALVIEMSSTNEVIQFENSEFLTDGSKSPFILGAGFETESYSLYGYKSFFSDGPVFSDYQIDVDYALVNLEGMWGRFKFTASYSNFERAVFSGDVIMQTGPEYTQIILNSHLLGISAKVSDLGGSKILRALGLGVRILGALSTTDSGNTAAKVSHGQYLEGFATYKLWEGLAVKSSYLQYTFQADSKVTASVLSTGLQYEWRI